jgi:phosphoglycolate phosphatase-like HAD superfamily hydrolase
MKKGRAVIFDCDGVMFDSRKANINFYNHILRYFELPPMTQDKIEFVHMNTADESIRHIFKDTPYLDQALEYRIQVDYRPFINDMIIEPGLKDLLKELRPGFGLAVATNRSNTIGKVIEYNGLEGIFDIIVSSLDVKNPKPHPESLIKILEFFDITPLQAFYIGDSHIDYLTARSAGVVFIAYKNLNLDADYHVNSMKEISEVLKG